MASNQGTAQPVPEEIFGLRAKRTFLQEFVAFLKGKRLGTFGLAVAVILVVVAVFAPWISNHDPYRTSVENIYAMPGSDHYFGGDPVSYTHLRAHET